MRPLLLPLLASAGLTCTAHPLSNLLHQVQAETGLAAETLWDGAALGLVRVADPGARALDAQEQRTLEAARSGSTGFAVPGLDPVLRDGHAWIEHPAYSGRVDRVDGVDLSQQPIMDLPALLRAPTNTPVRLEGSVTTQVDRVATDTPSAALAFTLPGTGIRIVRLFGLYQRDPWTWPEGAPVVVLDLRDAGGDDTDGAADLAARWQGLTPSAQRRPAGETPESDASGVTDIPPALFQLLVLTNGGTTGAAEALALLLKTGPRRMLRIGETTAGDYALRDGSDGFWRRRYSWWQGGERLDAPFEGLIPDLTVTMDGTEPVYAPRDPRPGTEADEARQDATARLLRHDPVLRRAVDIARALPPASE